MSFKDNTSPRLCVFIVCSPFSTYALLEAVIEKCLLNSCLFKLSKIFEKWVLLNPPTTDHLPTDPPTY